MQRGFADGGWRGVAGGDGGDRGDGGKAARRFRSKSRGPADEAGGREKRKGVFIHLCVCIYICVYVYVCMYMCIHSTYVYMYTYVYLYMVGGEVSLEATQATEGMAGRLPEGSDRVQRAYDKQERQGWLYRYRYRYR